MRELSRRTLPYVFFYFIGLAFTSWVRPATDAGFQALFLASFGALCLVWLLLRLIATRLG